MLLATLERAWERKKEGLKGVTFFYFTDNMATYYSVSKGSSKSPALHAMVIHIKQFEILLGCYLEVIHVPGTTIITEGTDDLSRGIWLSPLHHRPSQLTLLAEIFAPLPHSPDVTAWAVNQAGYADGPCHYLSWNCVWDPTECFDRLTSHLVPPSRGCATAFIFPTAMLRGTPSDDGDVNCSAQGASAEVVPA
jgi:hypothetical protein